MGLLSDILSYVDSRKRVAASNLRDIAQNPAEALTHLFSMPPEEKKRREREYLAMQERVRNGGNLLGLSVMPGVDELDKTPEWEAAMNAPMGLLGAIKAVKPQSTPGGLLGMFQETTPRRIINKTKANQGYSVNLATGEIPANGLMMGVYRNNDPRNLVLSKLTKSDLERFAKINKDKLSKNDRFLGTWFNPDDGMVYVDVSRKFQPEERRLATKFGERTGQKAGYDVGGGESFPVGVWEDFVRSPEFQSRMDELYGEGAQYMSTHPTREWWDMHGTGFESVYGKENLPQVAGFTASTAPNTDPLTNVRVMSEYMRRHIRGEPIIQPEWRAGADTLTQSPGTKLPMEQGRTRNLDMASKGLLGELRQDKVREEAAAMMGDPNAFVGDRWWARVAEDPSRGIFTASSEGVLEPGRQFLTLKDSVSQAAARHNRDLRNFSADVWAAIRERVKTTGELFGQKYDASAIRGESKGYADHFTDAIAAKAKHLNISVDEMEKRLRNGDANLLALVLASPVVYALYRGVVGEDQ